MSKIQLKFKTANMIILFVLFLKTTTSYAFITITGDVTWDDPSDFITGYDDGIRLTGKLTLQNVTLLMNEGASIEINNGGVLDMTNSIIKSSDQVNNKTWQGILYSHAFSEHFSQYHDESKFPDGSIVNNESKWTGDIDLANQINPVVYMYLSTISDAHIGVFAEDGMIVRARNSTFENNAKSVFFKNYEDPYHGTLGAQVNASYIMDCDFVWTKENPYFNITNDFIHLELEKVRGVRIGGCIFSNDISTQNYYCPDQRGIGIKSTDANFSLSQSGNCFINDNSSYSCSNNGYTTPINPYPNNSQRNKFNKLYKGVLCTDNSDWSFPVRGLMLRNSDFNNNFVGVEVVGTDFFKILNCTFTGNRNEISDLMADGACFTNSTLVTDINIDMGLEYEIYDNVFSFDGDHITHVNLMGMSWNWLTSIIQKNTFYNSNPQTIASDAVIGVKVSHTNSMLEFKCNSFTDMGTDILVGGSNTIKLIQGFPSVSAGNIFSSLKIGRYRLYNLSGTTITYYFSGLDRNLYDPISDGETELTMKVTRDKSPTSNPEGNDCNLLCSDFRSSVNNTICNKSIIRIFPQPAKGALNISSDLQIKEDSELVIYDALGKIVFKEYMNGKNNILVNTESLKSGIYIIYLTDFNNNIISQKFVIQN